MSFDKKEDISSFINKAQNKINPVNNIIAKQLDELFLDLKNTGAKITFDQKLESSDFQLSLRINSKKNISNLAEDLQQFDYNKYSRLWDGHV